jgi:hypothetical protein
MSHAHRADKLLIKPAAGARPAPPRRLDGSFARHARRPVTRTSHKRHGDTRLATASDRPTCRVSQSPDRQRGLSRAPQVIQFQRKEASALNLWKRYVTRRHRKQHERIEVERARQKVLAGQDVEEAVRNVSQASGGAQQGMYGHGT